MPQSSEYASGCNYRKVLNIPGLTTRLVAAYAGVTQGCKDAWVWLNNAWIICSDYDRVVNLPLVLKIAGGNLRQGCEYAWLTQGLEYAWINLKKP